MATLRAPATMRQDDPFEPVPARIDSYEHLLAFLFGRTTKGIKLGLENTRRMLERLGHPEADLTAFHVAGTNGKGSTAAILEAILRRAGYRTGLNTSPHLLDYRERIRVGGIPVSSDELIQAVERMLPHLTDIPLTFFEITTLAAFLVFRARNVQVAVVEVGLGGRLDATNVLRDAFPVVTDIQFDHERILGNGLLKIAAEKAGIIRGTRPVVIGARRGAVLDLFRERCRAVGASLTPLKDEARWRVRDLSWEGTRFDLTTKRCVYEDLFLPLAGEHQVVNAALAVIGCEALSRTLGFDIGVEVVREGLKSVFWPGRLQTVGRDPMVVLDAAHNPGGARVLTQALRKLGPGGRRVFVLGMLGEKKHRRVIQRLGPLADRLIVTSPAAPRAAPADFVARVANQQGYRPEIVPGVESAIQVAVRAAGREGVVCVTGSCYTVGDALRAFGVRDVFCDQATRRQGDEVTR